MTIDQLTIWGVDVMQRTFKQRRRIALVGNGTVEEESTPEIAAADVVVRFNNWSTRKECVDQTLPHGTSRCELLVTHFDLHSGNMGKGDVGRPQLVVIGIPAPFQVDTIPRKVEQRHPDSTIAMVNPYWNRQLCQAIGVESLGFKHPLPTLGMTAIYHLARMELDGDFYVCGFDWHYDPAADTIQGIALDIPRLPGHFNHYYAREALWIARNLRRLPNWRFSRRAARTLERLNERTFTWEQTTAVASPGKTSLTSHEQSEDQRYSELYQRGYDTGPIGSLLSWANAQGVQWNGIDVLDCGCGHAALLPRVPGIRRYVGVDVSSRQIAVCRQKFRNRPEASFQHGVLRQLPFPDKTFGIAWCCDVMEHLCDDDVVKALSEMFRVAHRVIFSICTRPSRILDVSGKNLHLTVQPADWWRDRIAVHGSIEAERIAGHSVFLLVQSRAAAQAVANPVARPQVRRGVSPRPRR